MLDLTLFRRPAMNGVSLMAFTIAASIFAMFLYLTLYIQDDLGYGPLAAGLRFLPITVMAFVVAPVAGRLTVRMPSRILLGTGMLLVAAGCTLMTMVSAASGWTVLLPGFIVAGIGIGTVNPVLASSSIAVVPPQRSGMASGANNTFRQVGIATGIAALGAVFQSQITSSVTSALFSTPSGRAAVAQHGGALHTAFASGQIRTTLPHLPPAQAHAVLDAYRSGFATSLDHLLVISAIVAFVGAIGGFALVRQRDFVPSVAPPSPPEPAHDEVPAGAAP